MCLVNFLFYFMFLNKINKIKLYVKKIYILFDIIIVIKIIKNTSFLYNILISFNICETYKTSTNNGIYATYGNSST